MRSNKHQNGNANGFLTPTVNSYKLHMTAVKSLVPERDTQRPFDIRLSKDLTKVLAVDALKISPSRPDMKLNAHAGSRPLCTPRLAFVTEFVGSEHTVLPPSTASPGALTGELGPQAPRARPQRAIHSAGATHCSSSAALSQTVGDTVADGECPAPSPRLAFYTHDDYASAPERLDLDRRGLLVCPPLEGLEKLHLLNLQHNMISQLQGLAHLQQLIFLDLYDNHLSHLSGLSALLSLRVLMLGRNRIQRICGLDNLTKLDVLDLHDNQISQMENLSHLSALRVLNLAGNCISRVDNLQGLDSLTELNLQRNCISAVTEVERLPCLRLLFLSGNRISSFDELACLGESCSLSELWLDGNPVAQETWYRQATLSRVLQLQQLDMKRITEKRRLAIRNAAQQWEGLKACLDLPSQNGAKEEVSPENSPSHSPTQSNGLSQEPSPDELKRLSPLTLSERPAGGSDGKFRSSSRPNSPRDPRLQESGGPGVQSLSLSDNHLAELDGETLRLFGPGALEALERGWGVQTAGAVTTIAFRYIQYDSIIPTLPRIRVKFPNLAHLIFLETNISRLPQLAALAQVRRLDQITIHPKGNPVVGQALWRPFLIYRLHHFNLQRVNGVEVTMNDVIASERLFGTLGHVAATETPRCRLLLLLEESRKRQLQFLLEGRGRRAGQSPEELRDNGKLLGESLSRALFNYPNRDTGTEGTEEGAGGAVEASERGAMMERYLHGLVQHAAGTNVKGEALQKLWPSMFVEMVRDCVLEMRDRPACRQASLNRLAQTK